MNTTVAVLPLARTTEDVRRAAALLEQGQYDEANAVLKQAEGRIRFDVADIAMVPDGTATTTPKAAAPKQGTAQHDHAKMSQSSSQSASGPAATGSNATPDGAEATMSAATTGTAATNQPAPAPSKTPS